MKVRIALVVAVLGIGVLGFTLTKKVRARLGQLHEIEAEAVEKARPVPPTPPRLVTPAAGPRTVLLALSGTLRPEAEVDVGFKIPGRVATVLVQRGATVVEGSVLAQLDDRDIAAQEAQVRAAIRTAKAQRVVATDALDLTKKLKEAGAGTNQQLVTATGQANVTSAGIAQAVASAKAVEVLKLETAIASPIAGVVVRAPTTAGFVASPGLPLFHIEKLSTLRFSGNVSERDAARIGDKAKLTVIAESGLRRDGVVSLVLGSLDAETHRVPIEGLIDNADGKLRAGAFVEAEVEGAADATLVVPLSALLTGDEPAVLVVGEGGKLLRRTIVVGSAKEGKAYVTGGLAGTDRVVADPGTTWRDGDLLPAPAGERR